MDYTKIKCHFFSFSDNILSYAYIIFVKNVLIIFRQLTAVNMLNFGLGCSPPLIYDNLHKKFIYIKKFITRICQQTNNNNNKL